MEKIISQNLDANESMFFARELETIKARSYDKKYPALKAISLIPVSTEAGPGAETITYESYDTVGIMKIIANYADDLPRADVKGEEFVSKVKSLGGSYGYNIQEVRNAIKAGKPLQQRKADAVRKANAQAENRIGWFGDADAGLLGLLNQPNIPTATSPKTFAAATVDEVLGYLNDIVTDVIETTLGIEVADTLLLPIAQFAYIQKTARSTVSDTTLLQFFLANNPSITQIEWVNELKQVAPLPSGGAGPADLMMCYRKDPEVLTLEIPQPFESFPAQERNLEFVVPAHSRIGGVIVYYPLACNIVEGI